jgi:hypothetical protein
MMDDLISELMKGVSSHENWYDQTAAITLPLNAFS